MAGSHLTRSRLISPCFETAQNRNITPMDTDNKPELVHAPRRRNAFDLVASQPWAIEPDMLNTIAAIARREGEGVEAVEARLGRPLQNTRKVTMRDSVAVVPITGPIFRYANLMTELSGATSLEVLSRDFNAAIDDPSVTRIVLDVNSPGGQATGIADFAAMVRSASKPVTAFVEMAASAAYWIASAAGDVVISKTGLAGNVGAVLGLDARKDPSRVEIVSSQSPNKRPDVTTDAGRAQMQAMVDTLAQVFIDDVAAHRGLTSEAVITDFGGGAVLVGADAVQAGMADRLGTLEDVIAGLAGQRVSSAFSPAPSKPTGVKTMTLAELRAAHPDLCAELVAEGRVAGAAAECARIKDVEAQGLPGHEALIATLKFDGQTSGPEAAAHVLAAEKSKLAGIAARLQSDAPAPVPHAPAPESDHKPAVPEATALAEVAGRRVAEATARGETLSYAQAVQSALKEMNHG